MSGRLYSLDAARGIAAFSVVLFHLYSGVGYFKYLFLFVDFFFVLSGFVLASTIANLASSKDVKRFIWNRVVRLFPMAYSALMLVISIQLLVNLKYRIAGQTLSESIPLDFLTLTSSFLMLQVFSFKSQLLLYPLWSLSSEWLANICAALIHMQSMAKKILFFTFVGSFLIGVSLLVDSSINLANCANQLGRGMLGFGLGLFAWNFRVKLTFQSGKLSLIFISITLPIFGFYMYSKSIETAMFLSPCLFTISVLSLYQLEINHNFKFPNITSKYLGRVSYGIYVWHVVATNIVSLACNNIGIQICQPQELLGIPRLVLVLCVTLFFTEVTLRLVEEPIRRKFTRV